MKKEEIEYESINLNKPENLKLEEIIKPDLPFFAPIRRDDGTSSHKRTTGKRIHKHIPAMYYFIHVLLERQHSDVEILKCWFAKEYVEMFSRDIEPLKSKNDFRFIWGILRTLGVIEFHDDTRPNNYRKSAKVYFFKLTDKYSESHIVRHQVRVKKSTAEKLKEKWNNVNRISIESTGPESENNNTVFVHQRNSIKNIRFDADGAKQHIEKLLFLKKIEPKRFRTCQIQINNMISGKRKITYSPACHRFFTPVSEMTKELRSFIIDSNGNSLIELDFVSCFPFIVYKILNGMTPHYEKNIEKIAFGNELDLYRRMLSEGDFYSDFKFYFFPDEELNRDEIKEIVLKHWFNGKPNSKNKYRRRIIHRLPSLTAIIDSMKAQRYEDFSNFAMRLESQLVNEIIYKRFIEIHPEAIMYTIFDSFLVEKQYSTELLAMMQEEGSRYFNINCSIKSKK